MYVVHKVLQGNKEKRMLLTHVLELNGLWIFSLKMRNDKGQWEPTRYWSYRSRSQAIAKRNSILNSKIG